MKILFSVHLYPPQHNAGGEMYVHNMAKFLISQGHTCRVLLNEAAHYGIKNMYVIDGVDVFPRGRNVEEHFIWADRIFTHLGFTSWTVAVAHVFHKPVFFIVHNTHPYPCVQDAEKRVGIIYNCEHARFLLQYPQPGIVLHPMVDYRQMDMEFDAIDNEYITLINLNENKGGKILYELARAMPDKKFLAVKGGYDPQIIEDAPNVRIHDNVSDIKPVYRMTRILICPSEYESWGMCATEAMCNGIPVICTPTFGLKENCAGAGLYVEDRNDIQAWVKQIRKLDQKKYYLSRSKLARERSRELDPQRECTQLLDFIVNF